VVSAVDADRKDDDGVARDDDHRNRKREQEQHAACLAARLVLVGEEVHVLDVMG